MEGLEITIYHFKEISEDNEEFRIDSEYYRKEYHSLYKKIGNNPMLVNLVSMADLSTNGSFKTVSNIIHDSNEKVISYIRSGNTGSLFINKSELQFISKEAHSRLPKSTTSLHDIIMARKGKIGGASIVTEEEVNFNCNENVIKLTINQPEKLNPWYFAIYFNSKYGTKQIERLATGNVQPWVSIFQIRKLKVHIASKKIQSLISAIGINAHLHTKTSKKKYLEAENILLRTLNLVDFQYNSNPVNIKSFSNSFGTSGRLDAEFYQIKYEKLVERIKSSDYDNLTNLVHIEKSIEPGSKNYSEEGLPFVRVSDYNKFGLSTPDKHLTDEFCKENAELIKNLKPKKETILFSKDGSVGTAYMLKEDADFITSGAVLHLTVKNKSKIIPEYLTLALNSKLVQMQAERDAGGSIILHWRVNQIENVIIPLVDFDIQREITDLVKESFELKKQSEDLLEIAKTAVEIAIEQSEETAIDYINKHEK